MHFVFGDSLNPSATVALTNDISCMVVFDGDFTLLLVPEAFAQYCTEYIFEQDVFISIVNFCWTHVLQPDLLRIIVFQESGNNDVVFMQLDLASLKSVSSFAETFLKTEPRLDILINNAGEDVEIRWNIPFHGTYFTLCYYSFT